MSDKKGTICFDMDGTIADLYGVPNWEAKLRAENVSPYRDAWPLVDMDKLRDVLFQLIAQGWEIRVISWLARDSSQEYKAAVRDAKKAWLAQHHFPYDVCHLVAYGTTKADCIRRVCEKGSAILIDDNREVRNGWHMGGVIDPTTQDIIKELEALVVPGWEVA